EVERYISLLKRSKREEDIKFVPLLDSAVEKAEENGISYFNFRSKGFLLYCLDREGKPFFSLDESANEELLSRTINYKVFMLVIFADEINVVSKKDADEIRELSEVI
ncbi:MAG: hypothetical protein ACPLYF_03670, partial [Fervidobacterium sp.]